jgi:hypothetical protein
VFIERLDRNSEAESNRALDLVATQLRAERRLGFSPVEATSHVEDNSLASPTQVERGWTFSCSCASTFNPASFRPIADPILYSVRVNAAAVLSESFSTALRFRSTAT